MMVIEWRLRRLLLMMLLVAHVSHMRMTVARVHDMVTGEMLGDLLRGLLMTLSNLHTDNPKKKISSRLHCGDCIVEATYLLVRWRRREERKLFGVLSCLPYCLQLLARNHLTLLAWETMRRLRWSVAESRIEQAPSRK